MFWLEATISIVSWFSQFLNHIQYVVYPYFLKLCSLSFFRIVIIYIASAAPYVKYEGNIRCANKQLRGLKIFSKENSYKPNHKKFKQNIRKQKPLERLLIGNLISKAFHVSYIAKPCSHGWNVGIDLDFHCKISQAEYKVRRLEQCDLMGLVQ